MLKRPLRLSATARTQFYPHQFKPLLKFLDNPGKSILIADDVGLGKTIEAAYILRELDARQDDEPETLGPPKRAHRPNRYRRIGLNSDHGQEGNQFSEIDSQFSLLGLWRWRCVAGRSVGTLRLESFLRGLEMPRTACTIWAAQACAAVAVGDAGFNHVLL